VIKEHIFKSQNELIASVAEQIKNTITLAIAKKGKASIVVPGGSTPAPVFKRLSKMDLDWQKVHITLSDERWLPIDHPHSNQNLLHSQLLVANASNANLLSLKSDADTPQAGLAEVEQRLQQAGGKFDLVLLGMGTDGHFASLFPGISNLSQALDIKRKEKCIAINASGCPVAGDYPMRISLTLSALTNSERMMLMITGQQKLDVVREALVDKNPLSKPIAALFNEAQTPVEIYWAE